MKPWELLMTRAKLHGEEAGPEGTAWHVEQHLAHGASTQVSWVLANKSLLKPTLDKPWLLKRGWEEDFE